MAHVMIHPLYVNGHRMGAGPRRDVRRPTPLRCLPPPSVHPLVASLAVLLSTPTLTLPSLRLPTTPRLVPSSLPVVLLILLLLLFVPTMTTMLVLIFSRIFSLRLPPVLIPLLLLCFATSASLLLMMMLFR